jgi:hypothetical protein
MKKYPQSLGAQGPQKVLIPYYFHLMNRSNRYQNLEASNHV